MKYALSFLTLFLLSISSLPAHAAELTPLEVSKVLSQYIKGNIDAEQTADLLIGVPHGGEISDRSGAEKNLENARIILKETRSEYIDLPVEERIDALDLVLIQRRKRHNELVENTRWILGAAIGMLAGGGSAIVSPKKVNIYLRLPIKNFEMSIALSRRVIVPALYSAGALTGYVSGGVITDLVLSPFEDELLLDNY